MINIIIIIKVDFMCTVFRCSRGSAIHVQSRKFHSYNFFTKGRMMTGALHINMWIIAAVYLLSTFHLQVAASVTNSSDNKCKNFSFLERSLFESL